MRLFDAFAIGSALALVWHAGMRIVAARRMGEKHGEIPQVEVTQPPRVAESAEALLARARRARRRTNATYALAGVAAAGVLALTARRRPGLKDAAMLAAVMTPQMKTLAPLLIAGSVPMGMVLRQWRPRPIAGAVAAGYAIVFAAGWAYEKKLFSDLLFRQTFLWSFLAFRLAEPRRAVLAPLAFVVAAAAMMPRRRRHAAVHLLFLRKFGPAARTHRLFEEVGTRWRHIGPIHLIAGLDSMVTNLDLGEFARMFTKRSRGLYVKDQNNLTERMKHVDAAPDADGRYRVNDFFCYEHTWRATVASLLGRSHVVLVDCTGYDPAKPGGLSDELALLKANGRRFVTVAGKFDPEELMEKLCRAAHS